MGSLSNAIPGIRDVPYLIAHGVVIGTGPHLVNSVANPGVLGQVLTSQGAGADPIFANAGGGSGALIRAPQYLLASGNYIIPAGCTKLLVELYGGGGGGGSVTTAATSSGAAAGGGAGAYTRKFYSGGNVVPGLSVAFTIGAAGAAGTAGGPGGGAGLTSFDTGNVLTGTTVTANGGAGGAADAATAVAHVVLGANGGQPTATGDFSVTGGNGTSGIVLTTAAGGSVSGSGGDSQIMGGANGRTLAGAGIGQQTANSAAGGSGGLVVNGSAAVNGGAGGAGLIRVTEYS